MLAVALLVLLILCVQWQVFGRYIMNDTPTWAESLALLLVLFVTAFGLAVEVRDAAWLDAEFAALLRSRGRTLLDALDVLHLSHGAHHEDLLNLAFEGAEGAACIRRIVASWRSSPPARSSPPTRLCLPVTRRSTRF